MKKQEPASPWSNHLVSTPIGPEADPVYAGLYEWVNIQCEMLIGECMTLYVSKYPEYSTEEIKVCSINLVLSRLLAIQYENSPTSQETLALSLFLDLPELAAFRQQSVKLREVANYPKPRHMGVWQKLTNWIKQMK